MSKFLKVMQGYMDVADDGTGGGGGGETEAEKAAKAAAAAAAAAGKKPTDAEAALLKEVMEKKAALKSTNEALEALKVKLKTFDGIDPEAVKAVLKEKKDLEEKKLQEQGQWDKLKKQMNDAHAIELGKKDEQIASVTLQTGTLAKQIADLTVGNTFGSSKFITDEMALTPNKARVIYGGHFEFKDGKTVAFDKPVGVTGRTMLVDGKGEPLEFDVAIKKIVEADPDRDQMLKSKIQPGAGSGTKPGKGKGAEVTSETSGRQKIAGALTAGAMVKK